MAETVFDKIIRHEIPAEIVFEDDQVMAFKDIHPQAPVHILIIPKKKIESLAHLEESDAALIGKMHLLARDLARQFGIEESGYRVLTNCGEEGGQVIPHLHFHLLGGKNLGSKICT